MNRYLRFLGLAAAAAGVTALVGWWPSQVLGGGAAVAAMLAGCGISWMASAFGGIPIAMGAGGSGAVPLHSAFAAMALRLLSAVALGTAVAVTGAFERTPLLLWIAISYLTLLTVDTHFALGSTRK